MSKNVSFSFEWVDDNGVKHYSTAIYSNITGNVVSVKDNFPKFDSIKNMNKKGLK